MKLKEKVIAMQRGNVNNLFVDGQQGVSQVLFLKPANRNVKFDTKTSTFTRDFYRYDHIHVLLFS